MRAGEPARYRRNKNKVRPHGPQLVRAHLVFAIGFAVGRSRDLLRRILREHAPADAQRRLAEHVVDHLERSGFELDEQGKTLRQPAPRPPHSTPR